MSLIGTPDDAHATRDLIAERTRVLETALAKRRRGNPESRLFALIDAARDERIHPRLLSLAGETPIQSLYQGETAEDLAEVSPYIAEVPIPSRISDWLIRDGWGDAWCSYLITAMDLRQTRRHLRRFNMVYTEDGRSLVFRFYDPRALHLFLRTSPPDALTRFFGDIAVFLAEQPGGETVTEYRMSGESLVQETLVVAE
jgi:hypothetical protein